MSRLVIEAISPASSVQDAGRFGAQRYGLTTSGAMDRMALAVANTLLGLPSGAAAIEIGPLPGRFSAREGAVRLGFAGAARSLTIGSRALSVNQSFVIESGETLEIGAVRPDSHGSGVFSYCAIEGGIDGKPVFGSLSVTARAGIGSPFQRTLQKGDAFDAATADPNGVDQRLDAPSAPSGPIRIVLGPQDEYFDSETITAFCAAEWTVSSTSDRMGYRLEGPVLSHAKGFDIISDGIVNGHIQIPGNGQPLVLLADRGTTGGYPKIGAVITADLGRFAQTSVGAKLSFSILDIEPAQAETVAFHKAIASLGDRLSPLRAAITSEGLLAANLAGGGVHALDSRSWGGFAAADTGLKHQG